MSLSVSCKQNNDELNPREKMDNYIREMATLKWSPLVDIVYYENDSSKVFSKDITYKGLPYTMESGRNTIINDPVGLFREQLDENGKYKGPTEFNKYYGSDCSSSIVSTWKVCGYDTKATYTGNMLPNTNDKIACVGEYICDPNYQITSSICYRNGSTLMYQAYGELKMGDALVKRLNDGGHARFVTGVNIYEQTVTVIEQCGYGSGDTSNTTWRVDKEYTFESLYSNSYIPVRPYELTK